MNNLNDLIEQLDFILSEWDNFEDFKLSDFDSLITDMKYILDTVDRSDIDIHVEVISVPAICAKISNGLNTFIVWEVAKNSSDSNNTNNYVFYKPSTNSKGSTNDINEFISILKLLIGGYDAILFPS